MPGQCLICGNSSATKHNSGLIDVDCDICGSYKISERVVHELMERGHFPNPSPKDTYAWQGVIRESYESGGNLEIHDLDQIDSMVSVRNDPLESIDRILLYLYREADTASEYQSLDEETDYPIAYAKGPGEFKFFLYKAKELGYLEQAHAQLQVVEGEEEDIVWRLSLDGWKQIADLREERKPNQAFVAMWFGEEVNGVFDKGMKPALEATGYKAFRVDMSEHNEKIDDRIIAEIRKSGLLVADFTGQRGGVYFEAGFAMGLGIPVIWTCREDHIKDLHFDTRQYNHIVWTDAPDLREQLRLRIEATVPRQSVR